VKEREELSTGWGWPSVIVADGGESPGGHQRQRQRSLQEEMSLGTGLGQGKEFLKTDYGHTGQSTVHVRCTPDSAQ
jgi:hypothetical protein